MNEIEAAKKLLERALKTGDVELIQIANDLLSKYDEPKAEEPKKRGRKKKVVSSDSEYVANASAVITKSASVRWTGNKWKDTGELGELGKEAKSTPKIALQPRDRERFKKVSMTCTVCNKSVKENPAYITSTEFYKCEKCMSRMIGR